jgi:hypothetical protein
LAVGAIWNLVPLMFGLLGAQPGTVGQTVTRLVVQDEVIIRVPVQPRPFRSIDWEEKKGPKCIPAGAIQWASLSGREEVDFILTNRARIRAKLEDDCPALDFYAGFYLQPDDERLCARRDAIHSPIGRSCQIEKFKQLIPKFRR